MSAREHWERNGARWLLGVIAALLVAAVGGLWSMSGQVRANTAILQRVGEDVAEIRGEFGERLRWLERRAGQ
ncbi:MAG: hypothetical protein V3R98_13870 [Alphaproteobacteria bacterium]